MVEGAALLGTPICPPRDPHLHPSGPPSALLGTPVCPPRGPCLPSSGPPSALLSTPSPQGLAVKVGSRLVGPTTPAR